MASAAGTVTERLTPMRVVVSLDLVGQTHQLTARVATK